MQILTMKTVNIFKSVLCLTWLQKDRETTSGDELRHCINYLFWCYGDAWSSLSSQQFSIIDPDQKRKNEEMYRYNF